MKDEVYDEIYIASLKILKKMYGTSAEFHKGQFEAIKATISHKRTLIVQKTGWGKSLVYFTATKLHRDMGKGMTVVISPLLVLMDNQLEAAERLGLKCSVINSDTKEEWDDILQRAKNDELDLILITPESLFSESVKNILPELRLGLFVIDEVHCISDWGHDFRLDYGNLYKIIKQLPPNVSLLGTTATANKRVIEDLKKQMGNDIFLSRGSLTRESLHIQVLRINIKYERYAWILENINNIPGSGIIYCLTRRDCDYLADFLTLNGINARAYHAGLGKDEEKETEELFKKNRIKAVVSTIKLGMGYDKGDISFVIHFQKPTNIVSYYQQIGRAGRNIGDAYVFLMSGDEDDAINNYFIDTAFPSEGECKGILDIIADNNGIKKADILSSVNIRSSRIDKALAFLINDGYLYKDYGEYYTTAKKFIYDWRHYNEIKEVRQREHKQMNELPNFKGCYSRYIMNCLDDDLATDCGKCSNCIGHDILSYKISEINVRKAYDYINGLILEIEPRKQWTSSDFTGNKKIEYINKNGICLSRYGDVGYAELVHEGKYGRSGRFCAELIGKSVEVLGPFVRQNRIDAITFVPSKRSKIVENFARELSERLRIDLLDSLWKLESEQQKNMENSAHQCKNAFRSFHVKKDCVLPNKLLLVDDIIDSKWTMTVCGYKLMKAGCLEVFPFALSDTSGR